MDNRARPAPGGGDRLPNRPSEKGVFSKTRTLIHTHLGDLAEHIHCIGLAPCIAPITRTTTIATIAAVLIALGLGQLCVCVYVCVYR